MASFVTNERPKLSYSATLPFCNNNSLYGRSVLLVGPNRWTQPLAAALLKVQFDGPVQSTAVGTGTPTTTTKTTIDPAVEALRRHVFHCPPKRVIHTVESLEDPRWFFRMDHIVILIAASTNSTIPSGQSGDDASHHRSINRLLHEDYTLYQRSTKVRVHEIGGPMNRKSIRIQEGGGGGKDTDPNLEPIPRQSIESRDRGENDIAAYKGWDSGGDVRLASCQSHDLWSLTHITHTQVATGSTNARTTRYRMPVLRGRSELHYFKSDDDTR
ncbi:hypothetical protein MHU86_10493 [Fragilaria crotonensis]|nr:hypothetical protein MHU86_10493 [Fragilaria crotonensis]